MTGEVKVEQTIRSTAPTVIIVTLGVMPVVMTVKRDVRPSIFCIDTVALSKR